MWKNGATSSSFVSEKAKQLSPLAVTLMMHEFSSGMNRNPFWGHTTLASISLASLFTMLSCFVSALIYQCYGFILVLNSGWRQ